MLCTSSWPAPCAGARRRAVHGVVAAGELVGPWPRPGQRGSRGRRRRRSAEALDDAAAEVTAAERGGHRQGGERADAVGHAAAHARAGHDLDPALAGRDDEQHGVLARAGRGRRAGARAPARNCATSSRSRSPTSTETSRPFSRRIFSRSSSMRSCCRGARHPEAGRLLPVATGPTPLATVADGLGGLDGGDRVGRPARTTPVRPFQPGRPVALGLDHAGQPDQRGDPERIPSGIST